MEDLANTLYITIPLVAVAAILNLLLFICILARGHTRTNWFYWLVLARAVLNVFHSGLVGPMSIDYAFTTIWKLGQTGCVADTFIFQTIVSFELLILLGMTLHLVLQHLQCCRSQSLYNAMSLMFLVVALAASLAIAGLTTSVMKPIVFTDSRVNATYCDYVFTDLQEYIDVGLSLAVFLMCIVMMVLMGLRCRNSQKQVGSSLSVLLISLCTVALHALFNMRYDNLLSTGFQLPRFIRKNIYWAFHVNAILYVFFWILDSQIRPSCCRRGSREKTIQPTLEG